MSATHLPRRKDWFRVGSQVYSAPVATIAAIKRDLAGGCLAPLHTIPGVKALRAPPGNIPLYMIEELRP